MNVKFFALDVTGLKGVSSSANEIEEENEQLDISEVAKEESALPSIDDNPDMQTLHRLLEQSEKVSLNGGDHLAHAT